MREVGENKESLPRLEFASVDLMARWRIYLGGETYVQWLGPPVSSGA